jgi:hypothetical protein
MPLPDASTVRATPRDLEVTIERAFAPLDKRALGIAIGVAVAMVMLVLTVLSLLVDPSRAFPLDLMGQFFFGYTVSPAGVAIGAMWGFVTGFCWGWFLAFARNLMLSLWLLSVRVRADMATSRDVLDHL